ncbi:NlpC/P60 family protein [Streptomyces sp. NPDC059371]|uniref:C40 family peptidase n=1 Tax=Streptomyces sp. NPDC059371 TaxID=3346812 RepID=UPI00367C041E
MAPERTPPSGEEVARRLSSLYDQAELATGNFNGTRALANSNRRPGRRNAGQGSGVSDAAQDDLMRQWFDGARSRFGPSAPAALPADRQPERGGGGARPKEAAKGSRGSSSDLPTIYELEQLVRPVAELTAAPVLELTAGPASEPGARPALELTAGPPAALPAGGAPAAPGSEVAVRAGLRAGAVPAAAPQQSSPHVKKQSARRKLAVARELMARHMARQGMPVAQMPAIEYRPAAPQTGSFPTAPQTGSFPAVGQTGSFPAVDQTGSFPSVAQTGTFPSVAQPTAFPAAPQTAAFPSAAQTGTFPSVGQTGTFPSVGQTGSFPSVAQPTAFPAAPQTAAFPSAAQTGTFPSAAQTGTFPSVAQAPAFQAAPQPTPYEAVPQAAPAPGVFDTGSMPRAYEPAPPAAQPKAVILPRGYEAPAPAPEYTSVLLPLSYEKPTRPSGYQPAPVPPMSQPAPQPPAYEAAPRPAAYQPAPMPPVSEPAPQPPAYEAAPRPAAYQPAPMPPVSEPAPQPPAYEAAPRPAAYQSAPMPPANQPTPPSADDAWRQSLRPTGNQQAWPAAPGAAGTNPGFDIDSLVTGAVAVAAVPPVVGHDSRAAEAVAFARAQIGSPCVWGASGPGSYDPSGLTQAAWKSAGVMLPRATQEQAQAGPAVDLGAIQPGDLVFFHANVSHVGLYVGDGMMVHAPSPGARISEESVEYAGRAAIHSVVRPV